MAPGKWADIAIVNNLKEFKAKIVLIGGKVLAKDGEYLGEIEGPLPEDAMKKTMEVKEMQPKDVRITYREASEGTAKVAARVIGILEDQIVTEELRYEMEICRGEVQPDPEGDLLKICVVERHKDTGRIGKGFVKGFGIEKGAIASTVAHDSHNIIVVGSNDADICKAINRLRDTNGGVVITNENRVLNELPLPVAGLMTAIEALDVAKRVRELKETSAKLGCKLRNPFMALSFLTLAVIPKLKITDYGLVDVEKFELVDLFVH